MACSSLLIRLPAAGKSYVFTFDKDITISDLLAEIRLKIPEANVGNPSTFGLFVPDPDPKHSFWLDNSRMLSYYHLCDNFELEYCCKLRLLVIQTIDGTRKTLQIDDSSTVAELMETICSKMGITNYEEYSLVRPLDEEERMKTLTLRKAKSMAKDQDKLERMKQKLHTDDELNWLAPGKTLRQHGIEESEILFLRRKYFYSDQNVDTRDPVQLNLLYIQLKEAIINGTHPISLEQAIRLAALQCQAEMGVLTAEKAKYNSIDLKEHLPKEYAKVKGVEKRIQERHKKLGDFDEKEAKLQYIQLCRSLPTYGITFFLIKEKLKGRNKLVPRLFGVSKESVMRVDEKTKEILETWPLTRIRRWAARSNLFILDFGQYSPDGNYAVQTTEGEQIGQLISGYIDIILRRQRSKLGAAGDADEENTIVEDNVAPSRANVISNMAGTLPRGQRAQEANVAHTGILRTASYRGDFAEGHIITRDQAVTQQNLGGAQVGSGRIINRSGITNPILDGDRHSGFQIIDLGQPKRALLQRIDFGLRSIQEATEELEKPVYSDDEALRGDDAITKRWRTEALEQARNGVMSHLGAMTMATGQLLSCLQTPSAVHTSEDDRYEFDYTNMDASLASIGMNVHGLIQCVRLYDQVDAAQGSEQGAGLRAAAQSLSDAFLDLMHAAVPASPSMNDAGDKASTISRSSSSLVDARHGPDRAALLEAASRVGDASRQLLQCISQPSDRTVNLEMQTNGSASPMTLYPSVVDWEARDHLLSATKSVANRMAKLVKTAKLGAMSVGQEAMDMVSHNGVDADESQLLRSVQARLVQAATTAGKTASRLVTCAKVVVCTMEQPESQDQLIRAAKEVGAAANGVTNAVEDLIRFSTDVAESDSQMNESHLQLSDNLNEAVLAVHSGLDNLMSCLRATSIQAHQDPVVSTLMSVSTQLPATVGDGMALVGKASTLASASSRLMADLRAEASTEHSQTGLSPAEARLRADLLEEEIQRLLTAAQECAEGNAQSLEHQQMVVAAAQQLVTMAHAAAAPLIRARLTQGLEFATRLTASNVGPLVTVGGEVVRICQGNTYKLATDLEQLQKRVMPKVNLSCSEARTEPCNTKAQASLLVASQNLMQCLEDLLRQADAMVPTIPDAGIQSAFSGVARNTQACLTDLRLCYTNSEQVLNSEPPSFDQLSSSKPPSVSVPVSNGKKDHEYWASTFMKINERLDSLSPELRSGTHRLLPDETLDSVCVALWSAVGRFNRLYPALEASAYPDGVNRNWRKLPPFVSRVIEGQQGKPDQAARWTESLVAVNELLDHLASLIHGVRGLAGFLSASANANPLDSNLARIFLVSHGLSAKRQSTISGCSSPTDNASVSYSGFASTEQQAQATAEEMLRNLLSIGESCVSDAGQLIAWALQDEAVQPLSDDTSEAALLSEQLTTSVNAILGYVPGEVIVRRLLALLDDTATMLQSDSSTQGTIGRNHPINGHNTSSPPPTTPPRHVFNQMPDHSVYVRIGSAARRLAKICLDTSCQLTEKPNRPRPQHNSDGTKPSDSSEVVRLAHIADHITSALAEVIRAAGGRGGTQIETIGHLLDGLNKVGPPVAASLRYAMHTVNTDVAEIEYDQPIPDFPPEQAILQLRNWAVELSLQADNKAASNSEKNTDRTSWDVTLPDTNMTEAMAQMRGQCEAAVRRVATLIQPATVSSESVNTHGTGSPPPSAFNYCAIRLPVNNDTYSDCLEHVTNIDQEMKTFTDAIPQAAVKRDAQKFTDAVKAVAQATCYLLQVTNQAAYLISASHPASKPGHASLLAKSDQLTSLHDHIAAVRKGVSELGCTAPSFAPDGLLSLEIMNISNNVVQHATQLCQSTRPLLAECKNSSEKKAMAESLERVARAASSVSNIVHSVKSAPASESAATFSHLKTKVNQLEEAVDQYADILLRAAGGSPSQVAEEALVLQAPLLGSSQAVVRQSSQLLTHSQQLITTDKVAYASASDQYSHSQQALSTSITQLRDLLSQMKPGVDACQRLRDVVETLQTEIDDTLLTLTPQRKSTTTALIANANRIESSLALMRSCVHQIGEQTVQAVDNWEQGHWELMAHNVQDVSTYLPNLVKESTRCAVSLSQASEQTALLSLTRTILEAEQQVIDHLVQCIEDKNVHTLKSRPSDATARDYVNQLKQACQELLARVNAIAKQQGGLNWHISSINSACSKLDYITAVSSANSSNDSTGATYSLPSSFVQLHTRLGHQSRALSEAASRLAEVSTGNWTVASADDDSEVAITQATAAVAHAFTQMAETVQSISGVLSKQTQAETGLILARRLCQITQAVGAACADFLRAPVHPEQLNKLTSRLVDLKSALQSCARGADACAAAATGIGRLVAELDTAVLFARTDALVDPAGSPSSLSPTMSPMSKTMLTSKQRAFQSAQEAAMQAAKGIVEDMRALIKNTATDQDALAVSAQNCLLRATELTSAVKSAATRASSGMSNNESCIESQVLLLTAAHEVAAGLVDLLQQGKAVAATCYALEAWGDSSGVGEQSAGNEHESLRSVLNSRQKALNETAVRVVENISGLSRALRGLSDVVQFNKTVPASPCSPTPPSVPPKRISLTSPSAGKPVSSTTNGHAKNSVHANLESTLGALKQLEKRLNAWSIDNGTLKIPAADCDWESEEQHALGHVTKPSQLISAAQAITQMAIKANTATGSGELSDIAQSADHLRRAAEELVRRLRATCQYALEEAHQNHSPGAGGPNGVMGVESVSGEDELEHSIANVERACRRAISGTVDTMSELKQMVEHMNTSLETGASSPASVQVTLAMRRLRETVYEIVDSANSFPGATDDTNERKVVSPKPDPVVLRNSSQSSTASDGTAPPLMPKPSATRLRQSLLFPNPQTRAEIEQSIAAANATAKDAIGSHVLQNALHDVAGEIERNVHRIGQLKTHHVFKSPTAPPNTSESALVKVKGGGDQLSSQESLDAVLSACQLVVHTTLGLMYWAAAAQRELVQQGRLRPVDLDAMTGHEAESQWAQGLISAARYVAAAANHVVESAQAMVAMYLGTADFHSASDVPLPEALISAAKTTGACTSQLVIACVAKADPSSASCIGLRKAGTAVKRATEQLVHVVQAFSSEHLSPQTELSDSFDGIGTGMVSSVRQVIETKSSIAAKQKELDRLHKQLKHINQDQYRQDTN
ncbi:Talin-1 [Fasciola hepatica]|uniref:Talin-1 n=1 Tax=Fasciola hepatica TaxID=6192 RepID=A0A4E0R588_FASHE|nr:Talin-1 [Fasciola hepatica]